MIKYFCDLCGHEITNQTMTSPQYTVSVHPHVDGDPYAHLSCVCPGCASVIMDTISKLRVEES